MNKVRNTYRNKVNTKYKHKKSENTDTYTQVRKTDRTHEGQKGRTTEHIHNKSRKTTKTDSNKGINTDIHKP